MHRSTRLQYVPRPRRESGPPAEPTPPGSGRAAPHPGAPSRASGVAVPEEVLHVAAVRRSGPRSAPPDPAPACPAASPRSRSCGSRSRPTSSTAPSTSTASGCPVAGPTTRALAEVRSRGEGFVWIGLHEPDDEQITGIAEVFGLHELAVEDAVHAHQRPKLERYDDTLFMVLKTVCYVGHAEPTTANEIVETGEVMVFVGADFVVTVRHGEHSGLRDVRRRLEADPEQLALGPAAVLHAIADHVVDTYLEVTDAIEDDIDEMEAEVFTPRSTMDAEQIYVMKREVLELRRAVVPLGPPLRKLTEGYSSLIPHEVRSYFRDVDDHLVTVTERVGRVRRAAHHAGQRDAREDHACGRTTTCARSPRTRR